jgi:hypothetical protein
LKGLGGGVGYPDGRVQRSIAEILPVAAQKLFDFNGENR